MGRQGRMQQPVYDQPVYDDSGDDPSLLAPGQSWQTRHAPQQPARVASQRGKLPSQQRSGPQLQPVAYSNQPDRRQAPRVQQSQDQASQWPLTDNTARPIVQSAQRAPAPQRPPRPNQVPPVFNAPRPAPNRGPQPQAIPQYRQDPGPPRPQYVQQDPGAWDNEDYGSPTYPAPNLSRPLTGSSRASTSSNYSVPDFPVPQIPQQVVQQQSQLQQQNRRPPLGPPPSARRGPLSYYPQTSFVPPIVEETDSVYSQSTRAHHDSYASSNAIPIGISDYYLENRRAPPTDDEESPVDGQFYDHSDGDSSSDHDQAHEVTDAPVRQASVGKRSKPTLTTIKSNDNLRPDSQTRPLSTKTVDTFDQPQAPMEIDQEVPPVPESRVPTTEAERTERPAFQSRVSTSSSGVLGKVDSTSSAEKSLRQQRSRELLAAAREQVGARSPAQHGKVYGGGYASGGDEKGFAHDDSSVETDEEVHDFEKKGTLADRVGSRRPPRLNVDAVREAEARGSLTSLPDLIRRATKLASNLDRGRTASRLGMDWFGDAAAQESHGYENRKSGNSLSDILNSFPPPGLTTPPGSRGSRSHWPSHLRHSTLPSLNSDEEKERRPRGRRCCGMPLWVFLLLLVLLLTVVSAAVVIPVVLVVLPKQHQSSASTSKALASCLKSSACENGGTSILGSGGNCGCLCVNGYTGATCSETSSTGCTTTDINGTHNATVGNAIPRLISGSSTNFSVPLNGSDLLQLFSLKNLSCTSENALVTFNGLSARSIQFNYERDSLKEESAMIPTLVLDKRQATTTSSDTAATSNGILFDSAPSATATLSSSSAKTTKSSSSSNTTMLDFARVAVLYVLQDSGDLNTGVTAQENLQDYFTSGTTSVGQKIDATNITLATGYTANLEAYTITTVTGASIGG